MGVRIIQLTADSLRTKRGGRRPTWRATTPNRLGPVVGHYMQRSKHLQQVIIQR
jgi:hypothetical protein|eukprot:SAG11_NODE_1025_length_6147_cov_54.005622_7_plen_54_part_00